MAVFQLIPDCKVCWVGVASPLPAETPSLLRLSKHCQGLAVDAVLPWRASPSVPAGQLWLS